MGNLLSTSYVCEIILDKNHGIYLMSGNGEQAGLSFSGTAGPFYRLDLSLFVEWAAEK